MIQIKKKGWVIGTIILASVCGIGIHQTIKGTESNKQYMGSTYGKTVEVIQLEKSDVQDVIYVQGTMKAVNKRHLYIDTNDEVKTLPKYVGDKVKKGEVIATFQGEESKTLIEQIQQLELQIANAQLVVEENKEIDETGNILDLEAQISSIRKSQQEIEESIRSQEKTILISQEKLKQLQEEEAINRELYEQGAVAKKVCEDSEVTTTNQEETLKHQEEQVKILHTQKLTLEKQLESLLYQLQEKKQAAQDDTYQRQIEKSNNDLEVLRSQKKVLEEKLDRVSINLISPMEGVIASVDVEEGQKVTSDTSIVTIIGEGEMLVQVDMSPDEISYIEVGQKCLLSYIGKTTITGIGRIKRIGPSVVTETKSNGSIKKSIPVEIEIVNLSEPLRDGMELDVEIVHLEQKDVVIVPKQAILSETLGEYFIYEATKEGLVKKVPVQIQQAGKEQIIIEGATLGSYVIVSDASSLELDEEVKFIKS